MLPHAVRVFQLIPRLDGRVEVIHRAGVLPCSILVVDARTVEQEVADRTIETGVRVTREGLEPDGVVLKREVSAGSCKHRLNRVAIVVNRLDHHAEPIRFAAV
ncbi:hypothetical protein D9M70_477070 [compost metagenome]